MNDFLGVYEGVFSPDLCSRAISGFERAIDQGFGWTRQEANDMPKTGKDDTSWSTNEAGLEQSMSILGLESVIGTAFNEMFWGECYPKYAAEYAVLGTSDPHSIVLNKIQRTKVGQGYHVWHYETSSRSSCNRLLTYIVYLNDVEEGGETEFLYLHKRVKPVAGTCVIFPASFTHTHRGNPPLSNDKYILTGWVEF